MLSVEHLDITVNTFTLRDISFSVETGDYFVLLGASGVGKTLLLESLAGLAPIDRGSVCWDEQDLTHLRIQQRNMGLVYQDQALFPHLTVLHNILYGMPRAKESRAEHIAAAHKLSKDVGVEHLLHRYPETLSGGEAQRVALARALATQPRCLLLDEPLASLDSHARIALRALLRKINREGQTIIHVTHDYEETLSLATHIGIMEQGTLVQTGTPLQVFQHPVSEFVARFIGIRNVFQGTLEASDPPQQDTALFTSNAMHFHVLTDATPGEGLLLVRSEDVTLSLEQPASSAQNSYRGTVTDIAPARIGVEVSVDIGVAITALVTSDSVQRLALQPGSSLWVSFKASAARFLQP